MNDCYTECHELSAAPEDLVLLETFYTTLYVAEFPDSDERESLENMQRYLQLKHEGWYGQNNYHVLLILSEGRPVAGSISDYLQMANAGVVEFLVVSPDWRRQRLGTRLLTWTEDCLAADAVKGGNAVLGCVAAEMHDPRSPDTPSMQEEACVRARVWQRWGYRRLDFDYVQPALSETQQPVRHLVLIAKSSAAPLVDSIDAGDLLLLLQEYLIWAMRIDHPEQCAAYREMRDQLERRQRVALMPLDAL